MPSSACAGARGAAPRGPSASVPPMAMPTRERSSPASITAPMAKPGKSGPTAGRLLWLIRRKILIADLREARRRHRPTSSLLAELRRATLQTLST